MAGAGDELLALWGKRTSGESIRSQNVAAALVIGKIMQTSLGPVGLDKMLVDEVGEALITNDGATILKYLDIQHPAAKILVDLAQLQDEEVGDGTSSVVVLAAELLKAANELIMNKIHPTNVINGYRLACKEAVKYMQDQLSISVKELGHQSVISAAKTAMFSKVIESDSDFFAEMVVQASDLIKIVDAKGHSKYPIKAINVLKAHGKSIRESQLIKGYALNCTIASQAMPLMIKNAKIACIDFPLQKTKLKLGTLIIAKDPTQIDAFKREEMEVTKRRVEMILKAGANVILCTEGIDDMCLKQFVETNAMAVRRCKKIDLKRIAKATGAELVASLVNLEGNEVFEASCLGGADEVVQERVSDNELIIIRGPKARTCSSIILRGPSDIMLDEMERSLHDALCVVQRVLESKKLVAGGGAVEAALNVYLEEFSTTLSSREQLSVAEFANALLIIPKTLASNAAQDSAELIGKLRAFHSKAQHMKDFVHYKWAGLDLENGQIRDNKSAGVLEPLVSKVKCLKFATEAAITILRIDDMIKLEKPPERHDDQCH